MADSAMATLNIFSLNKGQHKVLFHIAVLKLKELTVGIFGIEGNSVWW